MNHEPEIHQRTSIRLKDYDYSQPGAYFITLVTIGRDNLFGQINEGEMKSNRYGEIVQKTWSNLSHHYSHISLDGFVIMPNHVHGIIVINDDNSKGESLKNVVASGIDSQNPSNLRDEQKTRPRLPAGHGLSEIVRWFKSFSARSINNLRGQTGQPVWQRNYYEHIIRNQGEWDTIRAYIADNPRRWMEDHEYRP